MAGGRKAVLDKALWKRLYRFFPPSLHAYASCLWLFPPHPHLHLLSLHRPTLDTASDSAYTRSLTYASASSASGGIPEEGSYLGSDGGSSVGGSWGGPSPRVTAGGGPEVAGRQQLTAKPIVSAGRSVGEGC